MKGLLDKMELSHSNVLWLIGMDRFDGMFITFYEKEPTFYSIRKKEYEYSKGKIGLDFILDFKKKMTKSLKRLAEVEELLS